MVFVVDGKSESKYGPATLDIGRELEASTTKLPPGIHAVKVVVDPDDKIQELDKTNNSKEASLSSPR